MPKKLQHNILGLTRILLGWIFFWAFLDKLFGLGFATATDKTWLNGTSPTTGFLEFATKGPFAEIFKTMAGNLLIDWIFMLGMLLIGLALILGIAMKLACYSGSLMMLLMFLAAMPPEHNPIVDEHVIYILLLLILLQSRAGKFIGLHKWWRGKSFVKKYKILQ